MISARATVPVGDLLPGLLLLSLGPMPEDEGSGHPGKQRVTDRLRSRPEGRLGHGQPAIAQEESRAERNRLAWIRQRFENRVVPEYQLQQQRDVADNLDIDLGEFGNDPVRRQTCYADGEAQDRREDDTDPGDQDRVQKAHQKGATIGRALLGREWYQVLIDVKPAWRG